MSWLDLMMKNAGTVVRDQWVADAPWAQNMMVTNPVNVMAYIAYRKFGFERNSVFNE
jgi:malate/lactate dehydrogenase